MKSEHPPFHMIVRPTGLSPASGYDEERLNSFKNGTEVSVTITRSTVSPKRRKYWAILHLVVKRCRTPWTNIDEASEYLKSSLGIVNLGKTPSDKIMRYPRSLTDLGEPEFEDFYEGAMALLYRITGVDPETLRRESADPGGDTSTPSSLFDPEDEVGGSRPPPPASVAAAPIQESPAGTPMLHGASDIGGGGREPLTSDAAAGQEFASPAEVAASGGEGDRDESPPVLAPVTVAATNEEPADERAHFDGVEASSNAALRAEAVNKLLTLADDTALTVDARLHALESVRQSWIDCLPGHPGFISAVFSTAAKVIRGELQSAPAKGYLFSLRDERK